MVPDGYYYALPLVAAGVLVGWLTAPLWGLPALLLAFFFLWFFRDPERAIPSTAGAVVSPADGKVTEVCPVQVNGRDFLRVSIFLNVFNVHVNRSPIAGVVSDVQYRRGQFLNAMNSASAAKNEQNTITVEGEGHTVVFKQIAGLLARRIVCTKKAGDHVRRGERVGLIKFGSRVDLLLEAAASVQVKPGARVKGGSSVLAYLGTDAESLTLAGMEQKRQGAQ